jgi:dihydroorotate dehydrogenase
MADSTIPMLEIDNTIERLRPDQLVELAQRVFEVLPGHADSAPVSREELRALGEATQLSPEQEASIAPLAAWIGQHGRELSSAYTGPIPPFDHLRGFWSNFYGGPQNGAPFPASGLRHSRTRLLDFDLNFPFGVPACALTPRSDYIAYFAKRGFDLLTFKTVRDRPWNPHPFPQWALAPDVDAPVFAATMDEPIYPTLDLGAVRDPSRASLVNSFGVPSLATEQWKDDVRESKSRLATGQVLIVSVMGSPEAPDTIAGGDRALVRQFARAAADAEDAGADVIEVNLSCPNTGGELLCRSAELSCDVLRAVKNELRAHTPVFIKISYLPSDELTRLVEACQGLIDGIVAINAVPIRTLHASGEAFFPKRQNDVAGLSGIGIRDLGLKVAHKLVELREQHRATTDWVIVGVGGVSSPDDYWAYRDAGVDAVQSCSGAWLNHRLALEIRGMASQDHRRSIRAVLQAAIDGYRTGGASLWAGSQARSSSADR